MKTRKGKRYHFEHTRLRLFQRYDLEITLDHYDYFCHMVRHKIGTTFINKEVQKNDIQYIYDLKHALLPKIRVVWSKEKQRITTAIPRR